MSACVFVYICDSILGVSKDQKTRKLFLVSNGLHECGFNHIRKLAALEETFIAYSLYALYMYLITICSTDYTSSVRNWL